MAVKQPAGQVQGRPIINQGGVQGVTGRGGNFQPLGDAAQRKFGTQSAPSQPQVKFPVNPNPSPSIPMPPVNTSPFSMSPLPGQTPPIMDPDQLPTGRHPINPGAGPIDGGGIVDLPGSRPVFGTPGQQLGVQGPGNGGDTSNMEGTGINSAIQSLKGQLGIHASPGQYPPGFNMGGGPMSLPGVPGQIPISGGLPVGGVRSPGFRVPMPSPNGDPAMQTKPLALPPSILTAGNGAANQAGNPYAALIQQRLGAGGLGSRPPASLGPGGDSRAGMRY